MTANFSACVAAHQPQYSVQYSATWGPACPTLWQCTVVNQNHYSQLMPSLHSVLSRKIWCLWFIARLGSLNHLFRQWTSEKPSEKPNSKELTWWHGLCSDSFHCGGWRRRRKLFTCTSCKSSVPLGLYLGKKPAWLCTVTFTAIAFSSNWCRCYNNSKVEFFYVELCVNS